MEVADSPGKKKKVKKRQVSDRRNALKNDRFQTEEMH